MRIQRWLQWGLALPALGLLILTAGCGKSGSTADDYDDVPLVKKGTEKTTGGAATGRVALEAKTFGTIKGRVTFDGDPSTVGGDIKDQIEKHVDGPFCCKDPDLSNLANPAWRIGKDKGLGNVVVFLRPPDGKYFKVDPSKKTWESEVTVDQPFCGFEPHVSVAYTGPMDKRKWVEGEKSGQTFKVANSAPILHNTRYSGNSTLYSGESFNLEGKKEGVVASKVIELKPDFSQPVSLNCDVHKWMKGYVWALEHPYAAVTKPDGTYEIKNVPLDTDLNIVVWHEDAGFANGSKGETVKLKDGDVKDFSVKKK